MKKADFLVELAKNNSDILATHIDTKNLLPIDDILLLIASGFNDCSYGNDECPSFGIDHNINGVDPLVLMYHPRIKKKQNERIIYDEHRAYSVFEYGTGEHQKSFKWLKDAIHYYQRIAHQQIRTQYEK